MHPVTIPKKLAGKDDLVVIPRKKYEALLELKGFKDFIPTTAQKIALTTAEKNLSQGKTLSYNDLVRKLGFRN